MKALATGIAMLALALPAAAQSFHPEKLQAGRDSFEVHFQGQRMGTYTFDLSRNQGSYRFTSHADMASMGMLQIDTITFDAKSMSPLAMVSRMSAQGMSMASSVTIANGRVTGTAQSPGPGGMRSVTVDTTIEDGLLPEGAEVFLITTMDLADGKSLTFRSFDGKTGDIKSQSVKALGKETVTVPAGTFEVWKIQVTSPDSPEIVSYFVTTAEPRKLVLVRLEGTGMEMRRLK